MPPDPLTEPGPWNAIATGYDEEFFDRLPGLTAQLLTALAPAATSTVLDVATGPGTLAVELAQHVRQVVAIDFAQAMIERLQARLSRQGITNIEALVMDGQALEFPDARFDAAVSMFGVFLFADRARGFAELCRVLKAGARAITTSWATQDRNTMIGAGMEALRAVLPDLPRPSAPLPTQDPGVCAAELEQAGFRDVAARIIELPVEYPSVDRYVDMFVRAAAPLVLLKQKLGERAFQAAIDRTRSHLSERFGTGPLVLRCAAIVTSGVRA